MFDELTDKTKFAPFFMAHGVVQNLLTGHIDTHIDEINCSVVSNNRPHAFTAVPISSFLS